MNVLKRHMKTTFFLLSALLSLSLAGLAEAHMININPGSYTGRWTTIGQPWKTGPATVDLATGSHIMGIGYDGFQIEVDASGNVTSLKPTSATGSGSTVTFITTPVIIDPGALS